MRENIRSVLIVAAVVLAGTPVTANRQSDALRAKGAAEIYNLDRDEAIASYRQAIAADPDDAAAYRGLATTLWLSITFRRGSMTVDDYLGRVTRSKTPPAPPSETAAAFRDALDKALTLTRRRLESNSHDPSTHYELGAAAALRASYVATVEGRTLGAFRAAREAYDEHEKVMELDPRRKDAGLVVGTYRYIVSALMLPARLFAYVVGFGGGKEQGLRLIEEAAGYPGDSQIDARVALVLLYNREKRYDDALKQLELLRDRFPRNRLFWLESGATSLRAGRATEAERFLEEGLSKFAADTRPRMFGEDALWHYKRGAARLALGRMSDAAQDLRHALSLEGREWVHARAHLELGKLLLKSANHAGARQELESAIALGEAGNDGATADEARRLLTLR
jgi:tetratricopeptide (TPR) repeat protein